MTFEWLREELISILLLLCFENETSSLRIPEWTQNSLTSCRSHEAHCWHKHFAQQGRIAAHAHCGTSRYFPSFCTFYLHFRILHLLKGHRKSIWKSRRKAGVCAVTLRNCSRTKGRAELEPMMWNEVGEVLRSWHGKVPRPDGNLSCHHQRSSRPSQHKVAWKSCVLFTQVHHTYPF